VIQREIAALWHNSENICLVRQAMITEMIRVGKIIRRPSGFQIRHQLISFNNQNTI
jgi:hypothetical protein